MTCEPRNPRSPPPEMHRFGKASARVTREQRAVAVESFSEACPLILTPVLRMGGAHPICASTAVDRSPQLPLPLASAANAIVSSHSLHSIRSKSALPPAQSPPSPSPVFMQIHAFHSFANMRLFLRSESFRHHSGLITSSCASTLALSSLT